MSSVPESVNDILLAFRETPALRDALVRHPPFAIERRLTSAARRGDRLAVDVIDNVSAREDALDVRDGRMTMRQHDVSALIEIELTDVRLRVRRMPDRDEQPL